MTEQARPEVVRVLVVDDHAIVRQGLRAYLDTVSTLEVVDEAANGEEVVEQLQQRHTRGEPMPHVVLMDLKMPQMDGVAATERIVSAHPEVKVVVLTAFGEVERVHAAVTVGAAGYLLKDAEPEDVVAAIHAGANGEVHLDSAVARQLTQRITAPQGVTALSPREKEILMLVARGLSNQDIADALVISERTTRTHVSNILSKLQLSSRTQAALLAIREGLISPPA